MSKRTCSVDGCLKASRDLGLCTMHATRFRRTGTTDSPRPSIEERFWSKVDKSGDCWLWTGSLTHNGYGRFAATKRKGVRSHRYAYEVTYGAIPEGHQVDHLCHVPACVRPDHLEAVLGGENTRRRRPFEFANSRKTHCPQGHPYDEANTYWRSENHRECRACRARGG